VRSSWRRQQKRETPPRDSLRCWPTMDQSCCGYRGLSRSNRALWTLCNHMQCGTATQIRPLTEHVRYSRCCTAAIRNLCMFAATFAAGLAGSNGCASTVAATRAANPVPRGRFAAPFLKFIIRRPGQGGRDAHCRKFTGRDTCVAISDTSPVEAIAHIITAPYIGSSTDPVPGLEGQAMAASGSCRPSRAVQASRSQDSPFSCDDTVSTEVMPCLENAIWCAS
jgi:hypothetical protein